MPATLDDGGSTSRRVYTSFGSRLARAYTVLGASAGGAWPEMLRHFLAGLRGATMAAGQGELEIRVLRYDEASPELMAGARADVPRETFQASAGFAAADIFARSMTEERWSAWHVAKLFKTESWAQIAADPANARLAVLCADVDHTFFPGFLAVAQDCLARHDLCFEANFISAGTPAEAGELVHEVPLGRPDASFWSYAYVNSGMFAMRCNDATAAFWTTVVRLMHWSFNDNGAASEQDAAIVLLRDFQSNLNWGVLDPYAANHLSERAMHGSRPPGPHLRKQLDRMAAHHAIYTAPECPLQVDQCKLKLMRLANSTWFARHVAGDVGDHLGAGPAWSDNPMAELLLRA